MFTGIIEEMGKINTIRLGRGPYIEIEAKEVMDDLKVGDSVSINGVCLTVTSVGRVSFKVEMMPETLRTTNIGELKIRDRVNLERALKVGSRLGGHMVTGHVDGTGKITRISSTQNAKIVFVEAPKDILSFVVSKGSVTLDGVSLTIVDVSQKVFTVSLIPQTLKTTNLGKKKAGSIINIEVDIVAKLIRKSM